MKQIFNIVMVSTAIMLLSSCSRQPVTPSSNSIRLIKPYRYADTWVFDDARAGLEKEPFVAGIPELIDKLTVDIPDAEKGFRLLFSAKEFPGYDDKLMWKREEKGGNWYYSEKFKAEGWLCPALLKYYRKAPEFIYVKAEPLKR